MKKILGSCILILSLPAYAITGHGYKVLWAKETTSLGARGWIVHDVDKKISNNKGLKRKLSKFSSVTPAL